MKRLTKCMAAAAAVLLLTAGVASAQSQLKAEIPFAFSVGNKVVEPGMYHVRVISSLSSYGVLNVYNYDAKRGYLLVPQSRGDAPRNWIASGVPKLGFDCSTGTCVLAKVWTGEGSAYQFYGPNARGSEMLLEIAMKPARAN